MRNGEMIDFQTSYAAEGKGTQHRVARGQNFYVEWIKGDAGSAAFPIESAYEMMVLLPDVGATIEGGARSVGLKARSVAIVPAGEFWIQLAGAGTCCVLKSNSGETDGAAVANRATYAKADPRVAPFGPPYLRRADHGAIRVFDIDAVQAPKDNPRLKMLQSATMSINWVEYDGPRDRKALSPHSHKDFEQGSLALRRRVPPSPPRGVGKQRKPLAGRPARGRIVAVRADHSAGDHPHLGRGQRRTPPADRYLLAAAQGFHCEELDRQRVGVSGSRQRVVTVVRPRSGSPAPLRCRWSRDLCHASLLCSLR